MISILHLHNLQHTNQHNEFIRRVRLNGISFSKEKKPPNNNNTKKQQGARVCDNRGNDMSDHLCKSTDDDKLLFVLFLITQKAALKEVEKKGDKRSSYKGGDATSPFLFICMLHVCVPKHRASLPSPAHVHTVCILQH